MRFSKYEFNNKLLSIAHCLKLSQVELEHNYIYIYRERERERERDFQNNIHFFSIYY